MLETAYQHPGPAMVRYPRGRGPGVAIDPSASPLPLGKGEVRRTGKTIAFLAFGTMLTPCEEAAAVINAGVANMRFIKPLDEELILQLAEAYQILVTVEENLIQGGAGSAVSEFLAAQGLVKRVIHLGIPDQFIEQGSQAEQLADCGLDRDGILDSISQQTGIGRLSAINATA
jgi:1-deoxy-D-xylulose-5-phosphate synthase